MSQWDDYGVGFGRIIFVSLLIALVLTALPLPHAYFFWLPDWVAMLLFFWAVNAPAQVGIGTAFVMGLLLDLLINAPPGSHSLAYCLSVFLIVQRQKQIAVYGFGAQAVIVLGASLLVQAVLIVVWGVMTRDFAGYGLLFAPLSAALLWPLLNRLMFTVFSLRRR